MSDPESCLIPSSFPDTELRIPEATFVLTYDKLDLEAVIRPVQDDAAGAVAVFIGRARNPPQGASSDSFVPFTLLRWLTHIPVQIAARFEY